MGCTRETESALSNPIRGEERGLGNGLGQSDEIRGERRQEGGAFVLDR